MSCLFNSMSYFIKLDPQIIRNKICDYLETDPELMDGMKASEIVNIESNLPLNLYVARMRSPSTWGGAIEINCATKIFGYNFEVTNIRCVPNTVICFTNEGNESIGKMTWNGYHYTEIRN